MRFWQLLVLLVRTVKVRCNLSLSCTSSDFMLSSDAAAVNLHLHHSLSQDLDSECVSVHFWVFRSHFESLYPWIQTDKSDEDFGRFMSYVWDIKPLMKLSPKKCKIRHLAQIWAPKKEARRRGWKSCHRERKIEARDKWGMFLFKLQCNVAMRQMSQLIAKLSHKI